MNFNNNSFGVLNKNDININNNTNRKMNASINNNRQQQIPLEQMLQLQMLQLQADDPHLYDQYTVSLRLNLYTLIL
jgi:hypothetical protein